MHFLHVNNLTLFSLFSYLIYANLVYEYEKRTDTAVVGTGFDASTTVLGDYHSYWTKYSNGTFDLTKSIRGGVTSPKILPMSGSRKEIIIEPSRSALDIIDMRNFFLHP